MSLRRFWTVARGELSANLRRPMFWLLIFLLAIVCWGLSQGNLSISSGDSTVGGTKAWVNSQFNLSLLFIFLSFLLYVFFVSVMAGLSIIRDDEYRTSELLHSTPLRPGEYAWGKLTGVLLTFALVISAHLIFSILFFQILPVPDAEAMRGPFRLSNYLVPMFAFTVPTVVFFACIAFAVGERFRRPILVFVVPTALFLFTIFFLWNFRPTWLDLRIEKLLMALDVSGYRWIDRTWLALDRGVDFYNEGRIGFDRVFWANRLGMLVIAALVVLPIPRHVARTIAGDQPGPSSRLSGWLRKLRKGPETASPSEPAATPAAAAARPLRDLTMAAGSQGLVPGLLAVARAELRELRHSPGLYLFVPLMLLQIIGSQMFALGAFGTPVLLTSGGIAVSAVNTITLLVCLLLLFYTVESLTRERRTGFDAIFFATPLSTTALVLGKTLANAFIGLVVIATAFLGAVIVLLAQGKTPIEPWPFFLVWVVLLLPTFLLWNSFVALLLGLVRERYTTYALALAALVGTGYAQLTGKMSWVWNWDMWGVLQWSDMGTFEIDRQALVLNRVTVLGVAVVFALLAVRLFDRTERDAVRTVQRLHPLRLLATTARLSPLLLLPIVAGSVLAYQVRKGPGGEPYEQDQKNYWRKNIATWLDSPIPGITHAEIDLKLDPERSAFEVEGSYTLTNVRNEPLEAIPLTGGAHWEGLSWTLDGEAFEPEDRSFLYVFRPPTPLAHGESVEIGFSHKGRWPFGPTKNGNGASQFILSSGVVLHAFGPTFLPVLGYNEGIGVDEDNRYDSREYPDDYWQETLRAAFGSPVPFTTRVRITAPVEYTMNSVGELVDEQVEGDQRTVVWESDHPVKMVNVVGGRWDVRREGGTALFYHPEHDYNIDEMSRALQASRRFYSAWFHPFPWKELKVSEFPALAGYAQGFPTNITFSEGIGFLAESDPKTNVAFLVTAHEAAHQWWGNMVTPGLAPGGNILSEGMAHYSTMMLLGEVLGERERIEFAKRIEERYGDGRQVDSERPLVKIDGSRPGDTTVTYDKGGWVMWMLMNHLGREQTLAGLQEFVAASIPGPDHPVLQDLIETLRPYAADPEAYDQFVHQWYFDVLVPEYELTDPKVAVDGDGWTVSFTLENAGTGRMPVEVAVERGVRFPDEDDEDAEPWREERARLVLGAGESQRVELRVDFEPEVVLVDPDALVLQLDRKAALLRL